MCKVSSRYVEEAIFCPDDSSFISLPCHKWHSVCEIPSPQKAIGNGRVSQHKEAGSIVHANVVVVV